MVLDPIPQSLPVHFFGSRPQPPTSHVVRTHALHISVCIYTSLQCIRIYCRYCERTRADCTQCNDGAMIVCIKACTQCNRHLLIYCICCERTRADCTQCSRDIMTVCVKNRTLLPNKSLLQGSFAKKTYNFKEPATCSHSIAYLHTVQQRYHDCLYVYRALLQKRPISLRSLLIVASPQHQCTQCNRDIMTVCRAIAT